MHVDFMCVDFMNVININPMSMFLEIQSVLLPPIFLCYAEMVLTIIYDCVYAKPYDIFYSGPIGNIGPVITILYIDLIWQPFVLLVVLSVLAPLEILTFFIVSHYLLWVFCTCLSNFLALYLFTRQFSECDYIIHCLFGSDLFGLGLDDSIHMVFGGRFDS